MKTKIKLMLNQAIVERLWLNRIIPQEKTVSIDKKNKSKLIKQNTRY